MSILKVSIIIPVYNGSLLIIRCLESVFNQKGDFEKEVIVIDDGSTDNSAELICSYHHPIRFLQQTNMGPAAARNQGIEAATGKYLAFLDADDYWKPEFLRKTVEFLEENSEAVAVSTGQLHKIPGKPDSIVPLILSSGSDLKVPFLISNFYDFWAENNHICTGSALLRTDVTKQSGGQRPELLVTEDLEFWLYLATFGSFGFIPSVQFVSDGGNVTKQMGWFVKNKRRWKSAPTVEKWSERISGRIPEKYLNSFRRAQGRIARNLTYSMILSKRLKPARETIQTYGSNFPSDKASRLMVFAAGKSYWLYFLFCRFLFLREYFRAKRIFS